MERVDRFIKQLLLSGSWARHTLFWIVMFALSLLGATKYLNSYLAIATYASTMGMALIVFYLGYGLYLLAKKFDSIIIFLAGVFIGPPLWGAWASIQLYMHFNPHATNFSILDFYRANILAVTIMATLKFGKDMYVWQQQEFARKQEQAETELSFLKAQISPHFLFNTLNNLYGHAVTKSDLLPDMMLRLSDLLRYTIYDTSKPFVPLHDELDYIRNYVALEKMRLSDTSHVKFDLPEEIDMSLQIAPLILISFVENAFKHSRHTIGNKLYINASIKLTGNKLVMRIDNSYNPDIKKEDIVKRDGGIGMENVRKRLKLLYENKYQFTTEHTENIYKLKLQIEL